MCNIGLLNISMISIPRVKSLGGLKPIAECESLFACESKFSDVASLQQSIEVTRSLQTYSKRCDLTPTRLTRKFPRQRARCSGAGLSRHARASPSQPWLCGSNAESTVCVRYVKIAPALLCARVCACVCVWIAGAAKYKRCSDVNTPLCRRYT